MHLFGKNLEMFIFLELFRPNETMVLYKLTCDLLSKATHLDCHIPFLNIFSLEITGLLMEYSLDCFRPLDRNGRNPHKTKYVSL